MHVMADYINWHAVYVCHRVREYMETNDKIPTHEELVAIDNSTGSDPCDDCCCGACGSRKSEPGEVCC